MLLPMAACPLSSESGIGGGGLTDAVVAMIAIMNVALNKEALPSAEPFPQSGIPHLAARD